MSSSNERSQSSKPGSKPTALQTKESGAKKGIFALFRYKNIKTTEYPHLLVSDRDFLEGFQKALLDMLINVCSSIQPSSEFITDVERMHFEYPEGRSPFKEVHELFKEAQVHYDFPAFLDNAERIKTMWSKLTTTHKSFHTMVKNDFTKSREFLVETYPAINTAFKDLDTARFKLDTANHDLKNAKNEEVRITRKKTADDNKASYDKTLTNTTELTLQGFKPRLYIAIEATKFISLYKRAHRLMFEAVQEGRNSKRCTCKFCASSK
ncbi:unnamed protein product [Bursaphelenchus okinawaensis]|uniref:BAR domain-containing protein n=1 Tax=Bursaphelenchus okinawaensis TaxID=465554 RepID=A0A811L7L7_9BILA|nr:unnamed protein product [Bursaphelenchus okinawaensis]CAG9118498.1 unnamed protein product [Bursaphelenchus okinawaensis]